MTVGPSSTSSRLNTWLLGALLTLVLFIAGMYSTRLSAAEDAIRDTVMEQGLQRERIAVAEAHYGDVDRRLEEIAAKLDRALQHQP